MRFVRIKMLNKAMLRAELTKSFSPRWFKERSCYTHTQDFILEVGEKEEGSFVGLSWKSTELFKRFGEQTLLKALTNSAFTTSNFKQSRRSEH